MSVSADSDRKELIQRALMNAGRVQAALGRDREEIDRLAPHDPQGREALAAAEAAVVRIIEILDSGMSSNS
jgi:hypothetical protein